jgi:transposase
MRDRFDHTCDRKLEAMPGAVVVVGLRPENVTARKRCRDVPAAEKARIIVESLTPGANVSEVARRNGLSPGQLFGWRREARELFTHDHGAVCARSTTDAVTSSKTRVAAPTFVPVVVAAGGSGSAPPPDETDAAKRADANRTGAMQAGAIEIVIGACVVRVVGRVDADALQTVVELVRRFACS